MSINQGDGQKSEVGTEKAEMLPPSSSEVGTDTFSDRLELARSNFGMSQADMASALGVSLSSYHRYKRGESQPGASELARLAKLGFDVVWLLTGVGGGNQSGTERGIEITPEINGRLENIASSLHIPVPKALDLSGCLSLAGRGIDLHWLITGQGALMWGAPSETEPYNKHTVNQALLAGIIAAVIDMAQDQHQDLSAAQLGQTAAKIYADHASKTEAQLAAEMAAIGAAPVNRRRP